MTDILNKGEFLDANTMVWKRTLGADLSRMWSAVTKEEELAKWYMPTEINLTVGGEFSHAWTGHIGELKENECIQFDNKDGGHTRFEIRSLDASTTAFSLIDQLPADLKWEEEGMASKQPGGPGTHWVGVAAGWHDFVDRLEAYINGSPVETDVYTDTEAYDKLVQQYNTYLTSYYEGKATASVTGS